MRGYRDFRNNFVAGVLAPEYLQRTGGEVTETGLKEGTNTFITQAGTLTRRPGSKRLSITAEEGRLVIFDILDGTFRYMVMRGGALDIYTEAGYIQATLPAPWALEDVNNITVVNEEDRLIFVHESFFPRSLDFDPVGPVWSLVEFTWRTDGSTGRIYAPFTRFESDGSTVNLSGYAGTQTATFSRDLLTADYVGVHFLYGFGAQFVIEAVTSPTTATVQIINRVYPTVVMVVDNGSGFSVGEAVQTDVTQVRGIVSSVSGNVVSMALINSYTVPDVSVNDVLIGPGGSAALLSVTTAATPAAIAVWFEELITPARGFPSTGAIHRNRLCLAGFPAAPNLLCASATNTIDDFDVGDGDDADAIIARMGGDPNMKIRFLSSMEQLFVNTDRGTFYVDEGGNRLFTPALVNFNFITPDRVGTVPPVVTTEGVAFLDDKDRLLLASMTGTNRAAWGIQDVSQLGYQNINDPQALVFSTGIDARPERVLLVVNGDGTAAAFNYDRASQQAGWVPWTRGGDARYVSMATWLAEVYCLASVGTEHVIERLSFDAVIDCQWDVDLYAGSEAHQLRGRHVISHGIVPDTIEDGDIYGHDFPVSISPAPMVIGQAGRQRRRAAKIYVDVIDTGTYRCEGVLQQGYGYSEEMPLVAPVTSREDECHQLGSSYNNVISITQVEGEGAPLHIRSITMRMKAR